MKLLITFLFIIRIVFAEIDTNWWKHTIIYEVFIWSFKDSDGDGIGDLKGITSKLDHFVDLKIETLYFSPFYQSPMVDMGYDVSNYCAIDSRFGTMEDFDELIKEMKKRGLKLIIDLVLNHSSDEHPWFLKSIEKVHPYSDYYIWRDPKGFDEMEESLAPPNNWISVFEGSAWKWNDRRKQFYLHQFAEKQPDLNLRNKYVRKDIQKILKFWLDKGVAGFRLDATKYYFEDKKFRDEPLLDPKQKTAKVYNDLVHVYTTDFPELYEFIHDTVRTYIDEYSEKKGDFERILISEAYSVIKILMEYYGKKNYPLMYFPFNFQFADLNEFLDAKTFKKQMHFWLDNMPKEAVANWVTDNHDKFRLGNRLNEAYMDIILITIMMAPGVACLYYGQEIGMMGTALRPDQRQDKGGGNGVLRDEERLPMQWDNTLNSGFTSKIKPWLPVHPEYWRVNVQAQKNDTNSRYNLVKNLSSLRQTKTLKYGSIKSYVISTWVYAFTRAYHRHETYLTIINLGSETEIIDIHIEVPGLSFELEVVASSINSGFKKGSRISYVPKFPHMITMRPQSVIVVKTINNI